MTKKSVTTLAFAALCVGALAATPASAQSSMNYQMSTTAPVATPGPVASGGAYGDWSAARNVRASIHYDRLLETSMGFRRFRMRRECGPITDPQLRQDCFASFAQYEPFVGHRAYYGGGLPPYIDPPYTAGQ